MSNVIFHIDINAFFASAHLIEDPQLLGKPVVVCSNQRGSVVTTASYEARAYGVTSAMPLVQAKRLCPELIVIDVDFSLYQDLSKRFISIIRRYSEFVQQASIDECYVDMTTIIKRYEKPLDLAREIQRVVWEELRLPISIGVAPNKFLAKMASDMYKPNGITVLRIREVNHKLWPLDISMMHGIGKKSVPKLRSVGINTIGDLAHSDVDSITPILGVHAINFINKANGKDPSLIITDKQTKSIGQSKTYRNPITRQEDISDAIKQELKEVCRRAKLHGYLGKTIQVSVRFENYKTAARSMTFDQYTHDFSFLFERVMMLMDEFENEQGLNFVSITLTTLILEEDLVEQIDLFTTTPHYSVDDILRSLNEKSTKPYFKKASALLEKDNGKT